MAKRVNKLLIFLIVFIVGIVGGVALVIVFSQPVPNVNSVAFGYLNDEQEYKRFFYKEIYMTGNPELDNLYIKVFVNDSIELSTTDVSSNFNNSAVASIVTITRKDNGFVVTPKAEGDVTLFVRSRENVNASDKCVISVRQNRLSEMKVTKINEKVLETPSSDEIYDIFKISDERDNNKYNRVYLDIGNGNASSLEVLEYDNTKIEDIKVDPATFSLQIKVLDNVESGATTLVKLGWKEIDSNGNSYVLGQSGLVFKVNDYRVERLGFMLYTTPNFDGNGSRLMRVDWLNQYNVYLGVDAIGNIHTTLYLKPYAVYSSGFEDYDIVVQVDGGGDKVTAINVTNDDIYYRIQISEALGNNVEFTYQKDMHTISETDLHIEWRNGNFASYF